MQSVTPLEPDVFYHIYNRGINRCNLFIEERNFAYFLQLYAKHISPVADTFAYCLLPNHFHLLVRIRHETRLPSPSRLDRRTVSQAFNNGLVAYAKAINKAYGRTGSLFQHPFGRLPVTSERYFAALVHYIHYNPQKHGLVEDFRQWRYSSYPALISDKPTRLERATVLAWFGSQQAFLQFHQAPADSVCACVGDDD